MCKNLCANYCFKDGKVRTIDFAKKFAIGPLLFLCILFYSGLCVGLALNRVEGFLVLANKLSELPKV